VSNSPLGIARRFVPCAFNLDESYFGWLTPPFYELHHLLNRGLGWFRYIWRGKDDVSYTWIFSDRNFPLNA
jgi:hypothetical protein